MNAHRPLTPRQGEIVELLMHGNTYVQIARRLGISVRTVRHHVIQVALYLPGDEAPMRKVLRHAHARRNIA